MTIPRAAGTLVLAENTGRVLLLHRADGEGWSHPGGMVEPTDECAEETAITTLVSPIPTTPIRWWIANKLHLIGLPLLLLLAAQRRWRAITALWCSRRSR